MKNANKDKIFIRRKNGVVFGGIENQQHIRFYGEFPVICAPKNAVPLWDEFRQRYSEELDSQPEAVQQLVDLAKQQRVTLVYGAMNEEFNQAVALKEYLDNQAENSS